MVEAVPEGLLESQGMTEDRPERSAMGGNEHPFPLPRRLVEDAARPPGQGNDIFSAGRAAAPSPLLPVAPITRKPAGCFRPGQPLPQAIVAFAELRSRNNRDCPRPPCGDQLRSHARPAQVARIDEIQGNIRQAFGQRLRLPPSPGIQGDVGLALDPVILIPFRFAVANKINC